jgi:hypothetical protein
LTAPPEFPAAPSFYIGLAGPPSPEPYLQHFAGKRCRPEGHAKGTAGDSGPSQLVQTKKLAQAAQTAIQSIPANLYSQASLGRDRSVTDIGILGDIFVTEADEYKWLWKLRRCLLGWT